MKRLDEEKKAVHAERMKKIAEKARNRPESQFEGEVDMRVIEDEENAVAEPMDAGECSPEEYIKAHMDPNHEMVEVYDEVDGKWVKVPSFETGEANNWKVTTGIIAGIIVFIALVFWLCYTLLI